MSTSTTYEELQEHLSDLKDLNLILNERKKLLESGEIPEEGSFKEIESLADKLLSPNSPESE